MQYEMLNRIAAVVLTAIRYYPRTDASPFLQFILATDSRKCYEWQMWYAW
jgi:hypothetical protein